MADPVGTPLAALATAQQCVKLAMKLRKKYNDYVTAEQSLRELLLVLEYRAVTIENQVGFLQSVWSSLEDRLQNLQNTLLHMLYHKLQYAIELADAAIGSREERPSLQTVLAKRGSVRRLYFAFSVKQCLQKTVDELEKWHKMFDPTWYLICRISGSIVDASLQRQTEAKSVLVLKGLRAATKQNRDGRAQAQAFLEPQVLDDTVSRSNLGFGLQLARMHSGTLVIVDRFTPHKKASLQRTRDEINRLSSTLSNVDPKVFGLLQCHGVLSCESSDQPAAQPSYELLFIVPPEMIRPASLRARLTRVSSVSLNIRLSLAQSLSNAVMFVHSSQFVHKNIRPETILTFEAASSKVSAPYLLGFEKFRLSSGETFKAGDGRWESDLYRHPKRQGYWPEEEYTMLHDVYSLGVVLLEVGLWSSFITYKRSGSSAEQSNAQALVDGSVKTQNISAALVPYPGALLNPLKGYLDRPIAERARFTKSLLVDLAHQQLPCTMGEKYAQIVVKCLTCLDTDDPGLGDPDEFLDKDDVVVGVEFVESVIMELHEISY